MSALARHVPSTHSPRMGMLARLPIFLALAGKRAVVAGDGAPVAWKAELLSAAGAEVDVFAERPCEELRAVVAQAPRGTIRMQYRAWQAADLRGAALAVGGFDDEAQAQRFAGAARSAGVPVNLIDKPAHCDFSFGAIVNRSPLVIGISTDGAAPVFAQAIRARLETMLPRGFGRWAEAAQSWRRRVQSSPLSLAARHRFWQVFARLALANSAREPAPSDFDALMSASSGEDAAGTGTLTLIGTGSGDPDLLTLRAVRALQASDVILIDDRVSPDIVDFARREARNVLVGDTTHASSRTTDDTGARAIALAKAGKRVAWLANGAPVIRGPAEAAITVCRTAGITVEIVPGASDKTQIAR
jgi:uroporphyrin-III C-methyltransferase / precorrin-2 dehydrogenase / sirohydrochlorin ferrochelatase